MKPYFLLLVAFLTGMILGSAASVEILGESAYGGGFWNRFVGSLILSPFWMSVGLPVSLSVLILPVSVLVLTGVIVSVGSLFMGVQKQYPRPQQMMLAGAFLWSLGNASAMDAMMGI